MARATSVQLAEGIRNTIRRLERIAGLAPNDPGLVALKRILAHRLRELENVDGERPPRPDWTRGRRRCCS